MTEKETIEEIEKRLRDDRADLASSLADLTGRIAPEYLSRQVTQMLQDHAGPLAKKTEEAVRANPLAFALAGAGLAWLVLGNRKDKSAQSQPSTDEKDPVMAQDALSDDWLDEIDALRERASKRLQQIEIDAARHTDETVDYASERARIVAEFATDLRRALQSGLSDLNEEARARVLKAREAAYSAHLKIQDHATDAERSGPQVIKDHPLVTVALGIAIGAALVKAMPKPDLDRSSLGPRTNRLIDEAEAIYAEEKSRAKSFASTLGKEVKRTARSVAGSASDEARKTARDISDQAVVAGQDLSARIAQELADEASKAIKDMGEQLRARARGTTH